MPIFCSPEPIKSSKKCSQNLVGYFEFRDKNAPNICSLIIFVVFDIYKDPWWGLQLPWVNSFILLNEGNLNI